MAIRSARDGSRAVLRPARSSARALPHDAAPLSGRKFAVRLTPVPIDASTAANTRVEAKGRRSSPARKLAVPGSSRAARGRDRRAPAPRRRQWGARSAIAAIDVPAATSGSFYFRHHSDGGAARGPAAGRLPADPQRKRARRQPLGLARAMNAQARMRPRRRPLRGGRRRGTRATGPFTEQQAAAGRASYLVNCAGCHLPDLRGPNEAKPLVGPTSCARGVSVPRKSSSPSWA